jgi:hypothetical protein
MSQTAGRRRRRGRGKHNQTVKRSSVIRAARRAACASRAAKAASNASQAIAASVGRA